MTNKHCYDWRCALPFYCNKRATFNGIKSAFRRRRLYSHAVTILPISAWYVSWFCRSRTFCPNQIGNILAQTGVSLQHSVSRYSQYFGSAQGAICLYRSCRLAKISTAIVHEVGYHCGNNTPEPLLHTCPGTRSPLEAADGRTWAWKLALISAGSAIRPNYYSISEALKRKMTGPHSLKSDRQHLLHCKPTRHQIACVAILHKRIMLMINCVARESGIHGMRPLYIGKRCKHD